MEERIVLLGFALVFVGMVVIILGSMLGAKDKSSGGTSSGFAVGGFIGPIPFGFATSKPLMYVVIAISVITVLFYVLSGKLNF